MNEFLLENEDHNRIINKIENNYLLRILEQEYINRQYAFQANVSSFKNEKRIRLHFARISPA